MNKPIRQGITLFKNDIGIIARETLYRGFFSLDLYRFRHRLLNGGMSGEITREVFECGHVAVLLPSDPVQDKMVLAEQIRIAAYDISESSWLPEMVAGIIEARETVEDVVRRETLGGAGLGVGRTKPILNYLASLGSTSGRLSILVGGVDASMAKGVYGLAKKNEDIWAYVVSREQVYQWVEKGKIGNAASVIALQWLQLHCYNLRGEWIKWNVIHLISLR